MKKIFLFIFIGFLVFLVLFLAAGYVSPNLPNGASGTPAGIVVEVCWTLMIGLALVVSIMAGLASWIINLIDELKGEIARLSEMLAGTAKDEQK